MRTENTLILTLGTADGTTAATTSSGPVQWRPATGATDRAGNPLPTTARTSDSADAGF